MTPQEAMSKMGRVVSDLAASSRLTIEGIQSWIDDYNESASVISQFIDQATNAKTAEDEPQT